MRSGLRAIAFGVGLLECAVGARAQLVFEPPEYNAPIQQDHYPRTVAGDLDGDGDPDVVVALGGSAPVPGYAVLRNDGTGDLPQFSYLATADNFSSVALADVDEDGRLDLVSTGVGALTVRLGLGGCSFGAALPLASPGPLPVGLLVADVTHDAHLDLVVCEGTRVHLLAGHGDASFDAAQLVTDLAPQAPYAARAADLDADGTLDLVVVTHTTVPPGTPISVAHPLLGQGSGAFAGGFAYVLGDSADIDLADVTGDGLPDLLSASAFGVGVKPGLGAGAFGPATVLELGAFATGLAVADFDGDGRTDLAAVSGQTTEIVFWRGVAAGVFAEGLRVSVADDWGYVGEDPTGLRPLMAVDADLDGRPDLVRTCSNNALVFVNVFRNHTYAAGSPFLDLGHALSDPAQAPFDLQLDTPILLADGTLQAGSPLHVRLNRHGVEASNAWLIVGFDTVFGPFHGGILVPRPDLLVGPFPFGASSQGVLDLAALTPPAIPSGFSFWMQAWFVPSFSFQDPAASNAIRATAP